ncbi:MAG: SAVED domain-containing protein, partial [Acidobacteriota bacterium]
LAGETMDYDDLFIRFHRNEKGLQVSFDSSVDSAGAAQEAFNLDPRTLPGLLEKIDESITRLFRSSPTDIKLKKEHRQTLHDAFFSIGKDLHQALNEGELGRSFARHLGRLAVSPNRGVRLRIGTDPTDSTFHGIAAAPWETLCNERCAEEGFLGKDPKFPISRYFTGLDSVYPMTVEGPLKILLVPSVPEDLKPKVEAEREIETIRRACQDTEGIVIGQEQARLDSVRDRFLDEGFHVLHFIGHGHFQKERGEGWVILSDQDNKAKRWPGDLLATGLKSLPSLRLVVLSSCYGAALARDSTQQAFWTVAPPLMRAGIPALVAMQFGISDDAAIAFSRRFYGRIVKGDPIDAAASEARLSIASLENHRDTRVQWPLPVVFTRVEDPTLVMKPAKSSPSVEVPTSRPAPSALRKEKVRLTVQSFGKRFGAEEAEEHNRLSFVHFFDEKTRWRKILDARAWNREIPNRLTEFAARFVAEQRKLEFDLAAHTSIAFTLGWLLEAKSGLDLSFVQRQLVGTSIYVKEHGVLPDGDLWQFESKQIGKGEDLAVACSITDSIIADVEEYLAQENAPKIGRLLHAKIPKPCKGAVKGGLHALRLAEELDFEISRRSVPERRGTIHLFICGLNTFVFFLGQLSPGWGNVQLYEFAFKQRDSFGKYTPSILLPPRG